MWTFLATKMWHHAHPWINRVCTRLPVFSSFISYGDHQHWRMPRHGNLGQCSLGISPWVLHCCCLELQSVEGSPQISCVACRHMTSKLTKPNHPIVYPHKPSNFPWHWQVTAPHVFYTHPFCQPSFNVWCYTINWCGHVTFDFWPLTRPPGSALSWYGNFFYSKTCKCDPFKRCLIDRNQTQHVVYLE